MNMKKIIGVVSALLAGLIVHAQNLSSVNLDTLVARELDSMVVRLSLSAEQRSSISTIQLTYYESVRNLNTNISIDARTNALDSIGLLRDQGLQTVLTEAQWSSHQAYLLQRRQAAAQAIEERRNRHRQQSQNP